MKLAFSTLGCPEWTLKHAIDQAEAMGFSAIEIRGIGDRLRADTIRELLPRESVSSPPGSTTDSPEGVTCRPVAVTTSNGF